MAKNRKRRRISDNVLLPYVSDEVEKVNEQSLSDSEKRANETVDSLIRDLFGEGEKVSAPAPVALAEQAEPDEEDGIVGEVREESDADFSVNAEGVEEAEPLSAFSKEEGDPPFEELSPAYEEAEDLTLKEQIESSTKEFKLLLDMDYEDELGNAIGFEKIRTYHERNINGRDLSRGRRRRQESKEFEKQSQDVSLRRAYVKQKTRWLLRFCACALIWVLLLFYERGTWMATVLGGPFDGAVYSVSYILIGVQLLLISSVLCHKPLLQGFSRLVRYSPTDYSLFSVVLLATFLYHFVLLFLPNQGYPLLYLSPAALCLAILSGVEFLNWYRESCAFDVVSARRQKYALLPRISVGSRDAGARRRLLGNDAKERVLYARPVGFVRDYFANTSVRVENHRNFGALVLLLLAISVTFGMYVLVSGGEASEVWSTVFATFLLCTPAVSLLLTSVPMFFASLLRLRGKSAIVGEEPVSSCAEPTVLVLPDAEIIASMEHEHLRLAEGCDAHSVSVLLRAFLEKLQSSLADSFGVEEGLQIDPDSFTVTELEENGATLTLEESGIVMQLGTLEYLEARGISCAVRRDVAPELARRRLCVALDGVFAAVFAVRYTLSADAPQLLRELDRSGVGVTLRSMDPCVRAEVLADLLPGLSAPVSVSKPDVCELELHADRVDATVVALGSCKEVARAYAACCRVRRVGRFGKLLQTLSIGTGMALSAVCALMLGTPSGLVLTLWMLWWCSCYAVLSYFSLRRPVDEL